MQTRIKAIYPFFDQFKIVEPFGYASKGIPGLDIVINGKSGKMLKEKFIFLSRCAGLRFPLKHFVLCLEGEISEESLTWIELPLYILYLSLGELLPIAHLEDCLCSGRIYASGRFASLYYSDSLLEFLEAEFPDDKILVSRLLNKKSGNYQFPLEVLFEQISYFTFAQEKPTKLLLRSSAKKLIGDQPSSFGLRPIELV